MPFKSCSAVTLAIVMLSGSVAPCVARPAPDDTTRQQYEQHIAEARERTPAMRAFKTGATDVRQMHIDPMRGDVLVFGGTFAGGVSFQRQAEAPFPIELAGDIAAAAVDSKQARFFLGIDDGLIRQYNRGSFDPARTYPEDTMFPDPGIRAVVVSPDDQWLAVAGDSASVRLYQLAEGRELPPFTAPAAAVTCVAFSTGAWAVCGDADGDLYRFQVDDPEQSSTIAEHDAAVVGVGVADDGTIYAATADGKVTAINADSGAAQTSAQPLDGGVDFMQFAYDFYGKPLVLVGAVGGQVALLDGETLDARTTIDAPPGITSLRTDTFAIYVTAAYRDGTIRQWFLPKLADEDAS